MCDYPITPLPPHTNTMYELYAKVNGNTVEQQMVADTFTCDNGTKVVRYVEYVKWVFKMQTFYFVNNSSNVTIAQSVFFDPKAVQNFIRKMLVVG